MILKNKRLVVILSIVIVIETILLINVWINKMTFAKDNNETQYSYLMDNPIDAYYGEIFKNSNVMVEYRDAQDNYEKVWKKEYTKVIKLLYSKCTYDADKKNLENYDTAVKKLIKQATPVMETELLNSYQEDPTVPENRGWGNSTASSLLSIKGQIYRDASMLLIPYLEEYNFPKMN